MKVTKAYILGVGSGLILSALLALIIPDSNLAVGHFAKAQQPQNTNVSTNEAAQSSPTSQASQPPQTNQASPANTPQLNPSSTTELSNSNKVASQATPAGNKQVFAIPPGSSADKIAELLVNEGLLKEKASFLDAVQKRGAASRFRAGNFELSKGLTAEEIITILLK